MTIPTLTSDRLLLREVTLDDEENYVTLLTDPKVMTYYPTVPDREGCRLWLDRTLARYERDGHSFWAVTRLEDGEFLGICGILEQIVEEQQHSEIAYLFCRAHWHQGYAAEAARRCRDHAFADLGIDHLISIIHPENHPSMKVAERNGMVLQRIAPFRNLEAARIYGIHHDEWLARGLNRTATS